MATGGCSFTTILRTLGGSGTGGGQVRPLRLRRRIHCSVWCEFRLIYTALVTVLVTDLGLFHVQSCGDSTVTAPEGYTLTVTPEAVTIAASTGQGAAYGLTTLAQLLRYDTALATSVLKFRLFFFFYHI